MLYKLNLPLDAEEKINVPPKFVIISTAVHFEAENYSVNGTIYKSSKLFQQEIIMLFMTILKILKTCQLELEVCIFIFCFNDNLS